jgi:ketosteroid isomerase-like protein
MSGCAAVSSASSSNGTHSSSGVSTAALGEVEAVERARFKAWIAADAAAMRPMLGEDLVYCHSTGQCQNKDEIVASIASRDTIYHAMDIVYMKPRLVDGAVVINGKLNIRAESGGKVAEFQGIYTDVYAKRDGRWQLVSWQSTRVP